MTTRLKNNPYAFLPQYLHPSYMDSAKIVLDRVTSILAIETIVKSLPFQLRREVEDLHCVYNFVVFGQEAEIDSASQINRSSALLECLRRFPSSQILIDQLKDSIYHPRADLMWHEHFAITWPLFLKANCSVPLGLAALITQNQRYRTIRNHCDVWWSQCPIDQDLTSKIFEVYNDSVQFSQFDPDTLQILFALLVKPTGGMTAVSYLPAETPGRSSLVELFKLNSNNFEVMFFHDQSRSRCLASVSAEFLVQSACQDPDVYGSNPYKVWLVIDPIGWMPDFPLTSTLSDKDFDPISFLISQATEVIFDWRKSDNREVFTMSPWGFSANLQNIQPLKFSKSF